MPEGAKESFSPKAMSKLSWVMISHKSRGVKSSIDIEQVFEQH